MGDLKISRGTGDDDASVQSVRSLRAWVDSRGEEPLRAFVAAIVEALESGRMVSASTGVLPLRRRGYFSELCNTPDCPNSARWIPVAPYAIRDEGKYYCVPCCDRFAAQD